MKTNHKYSIYQVLIFVLLFTIIISNECDRSTPIRFNGGECELKFCTVEEYKSGKCVIDNEIAKTQYLNEITILDSGNENSKFDLVKFANGSLVSTISYSINSESYIKFYALSSNEQRFFLEKYEKEIIEENKNNGKEEDKKNNVDNGDDNKDEDNNQGNDNENKTVYKTEYYELLNKFKSQWKEVDEAYQNKNVPSLIPNGVRERRQIEIQNLNISVYKQLKERYEALKSKKYSYDFSEFDKKNYNTMEEYKNKSGEQLIQISKEKIKKQDEHLDDIESNVKIYESKKLFM